MHWIDKLNNLVLRRRPVQTRRWDEHGLHMSEGTTHVSIPWSQVRQVIAYKKDCYTIDQMRLLVLSQEHGIEFSEDDLNFSELCSFLSHKLGIGNEWHLSLLLSPAFDETPTRIFPTDDA